MSWKEWQYELDEANKGYDAGRINYDTYEARVKTAIYMIYKAGNTSLANSISRAHGYSLDKIIKEEE